MDQQTTNFDVRYFLNALLNGKWIIVATTVLGMTLAITSNYLQTLSYRATGQIQIQFSRGCQQADGLAMPRWPEVGAAVRELFTIARRLTRCGV